MSDIRTTALSKYRCHKEVKAAKIIGMQQSPCDDAVVLELEGELSEITVQVSAKWLAAHSLVEVGGYYVVYEDADGYTAYSPAKAFEDGYTRISCALLKKGERVKTSGNREFIVAVDQVALDEYPYIDVVDDEGESWSFPPIELTRITAD